MRPAESFISQPVRSLQTMLRVIGEDRGQAITVIPDGFYGQQTRGAVSGFQRSHGIPATGVTDQNTWDRVVEEFEPAWVRVGPAEPLQLILNPNQVLHRGEAHPYLYLIQGMLLAMAQVYESISLVELTGVLDSLTAQALMDFQALSGLPTTGEVDKITWKHLARQYPLAVNIEKSQNRNRQ